MTTPYTQTPITPTYGELVYVSVASTRITGVTSVTTPTEKRNMVDTTTPGDAVKTARPSIALDADKLVIKAWYQPSVFSTLRGYLTAIPCASVAVSVVITSDGQTAVTGGTFAWASAVPESIKMSNTAEEDKNVEMEFTLTLTSIPTVS